MRLSALKGFELQDFALPESEEYRLVLYALEQEPPVYISEKLAFSPSAQNVVTNTVSFEESTCRRSFLVAVQLCNGSQLVKEWLLDLRTARPSKNARSPQSLLLQTESGLMAVSTDEHLPSSDSVSSTRASSVNIPNRTPRSSTPMSQATDHEVTPHESPRASLISRWFPTWQSSPGEVTAKANALSSLPYSMLVDLWTLQKILDEARVASQDLCSQIDEQLQISALPIEEKEKQLGDRLEKIRRRSRKVVAETAEFRQKAARLRTTLRKRKTLLDHSLLMSESSDATKDVVNGAQPNGVHPNGEHLNGIKPNGAHRPLDIRSQIKHEQARLSMQLMEIFPIESMGDVKFHFTIRGLVLPSVFAINHFDTTQIAAALGYVAQVLVCLSRYLDVTLPYPITVCGSQSYITDEISLIKHGSTKFPLWTRGALLYRVEYALYLLHKDIDELMVSLGLAVADLKQTLANLQNILLVVSSYA